MQLKFLCQKNYNRRRKVIISTSGKFCEAQLRVEQKS